MSAGPAALCLPLSDAPAADVAGGKAASLGALIRAGLPVPDGFVVTAAAFSPAIAQADPGGALRAAAEALGAGDMAGIAAAAARLRAAVLATPLPAPARAAISARYDALAAPGDPGVAVRSSATMEDSAAASFAGLQDTYLGVRDLAGVLDAVRRCWASLYNEESLAYRRRIAMPESALSMAVVVQKMVTPRAAGVMFTRSPVTGDRSVIAVEAVPGLGAALVSGEVTPDGFTVSKVTGEVTSRRPAGPQPALTDPELQALAGVARTVEAHYGAAQDIEWAVLGGDSDPAARVVLLQSRPETVWAARDAAAQRPVAVPKARPADHVLALFATPQKLDRR